MVHSLWHWRLHNFSCAWIATMKTLVASVPIVTKLRESFILIFIFPFPPLAQKSTSAGLLPEWRTFLTDNSYSNVQEWLTGIGGENKQGNINKDECQRILKALSLKTFEGSHKIHILWMAEYLGKEGNRLLKIIEEPPPGTIFILIASHQEQILNTILSRCQLVSFAALDDEDLFDAIKQRQPQISDDDAMQITYLANGDLGLALKQLENKEDLAAGLWLTWMRTTFKGNPIEIVKWTDQFAKLDRESQKRFLGYGLHFLREMILQKVTQDMPVRLIGNEKTALEKLKKIIPLTSLQLMIELVSESIFHIERNANSKILMLDNSIKMHHLFRKEHKMIA